MLVEPSPVFLPDIYDSNHLHRQYRSGEDPKPPINIQIITDNLSYTPVQVINCKYIYFCSNFELNVFYYV